MGDTAIAGAAQHQEKSRDFCFLLTWCKMTVSKLGAFLSASLLTDHHSFAVRDRSFQKGHEVREVQLTMAPVGPTLGALLPSAGTPVSLAQGCPDWTCFRGRQACPMRVRESMAQVRLAWSDLTDCVGDRSWLLPAVWSCSGVSCSCLLSAEGDSALTLIEDASGSF